MRVALAAAIVVLTLARCECSGGPCTTDADCDPQGQGYRGCAVDTGLCVCRDDRGCGDGERCNTRGSCQVIAGCVNNDDCGAGQFCDARDATCVPLDVCGDATCCAIDGQCPFGSVCEPITFRCVQGCRDEGDCRLGQGCEGGGFGRLGTCGTRCTTDQLCGPGQLCEAETGTCVRDDRGPYCVGCAGGVQSDDCGSRGNYCLLDTINGGAYCGVDCSQGQACPNAYECRDVIILPAATLPTCALPEACEAGVCARSQTSCAQDEDCPEGPPGSNCPRADIGNCDTDVTTACASDADCEGSCLKQECRGREGASFGVCSCTRNSDCPRDRCVGGDAAAGVRGSCELSGHDCYGDPDCDVITCVQGGCLLGRNCKPSNDRTCADLLETDLE
jgi:hypothetical protein